MTKSLQAIQAAQISSTLPSLETSSTATIFKPVSGDSTAGGEKGIAEELEEAGDEVLRELKEAQREALDSLDLKK